MRFDFDEFASLFPELQPWAAILSYENTGTLHTINFSNRLISNVLTRLSNEIRLHIPSNFLENSTLPLLYIEFLEVGDFSPFESFESSPILSVSDEDRLQDCDFVNAYFSLYSCFSDHSQIPTFLAKIRNNDVLQAIVVDIFSLMFMKPGRFTLPIATDICQSLRPFAVPPVSSEIDKALSRLTLARSPRAVFLPLPSLLVAADDEALRAASPYEASVATYAANKDSGECTGKFKPTRSMKTASFAKFDDPASWKRSRPRKNCPLLNGFLDEVDTVVELFPLLPVADALALPPERLLSDFANAGQMHDAQLVARSRGLPLPLALYNDQRVDRNKVFANAPVMTRYLNRASPQPSDDKADLNLAFNALNQEKVTDLSFTMKSDDFLDVMYQKISPRFVEWLSAFESELGLDICEPLSLLRRVNIYPLTAAFSHLLDTDVPLASQFFTALSFRFNATKYLRDAVLRRLKAGQPAADLVDACPTIRREVIESLPTRYRDMITRPQQINPNWTPAADPVALLKANCNDADGVVTFLSNAPEVNFDSEFIAMAKRGQLSLVTRKFFPVVRDKATVCQFITRLLSAQVSELQIFSVKEEASVAAAFKEDAELLQCMIEQLEQDSRSRAAAVELRAQLLTLLEPIRYGLYSRYGKTIHFRDFRTPQFGDAFVSTCYKYDMIDSANRGMSVWNVSATAAREAYSTICFELGQEEAGLIAAPGRRRGTSANSLKESAEFANHMISRLSSPLCHNLSFLEDLAARPSDALRWAEEFDDHAAVKEKALKAPQYQPKNQSRQEPQTPVRQAPQISRSRSRVTFNIPTRTPSRALFHAVDFSPNFYIRTLSILRGFRAPQQDHAPLLRHFLRTVVTINDQVQYFVSCGSFQKAFKYIRKAGNDQAKWNVFLNSIFVPAISSQYFTRLKFRMQEDEEQMKFFGPYFEKLLRFVKRNSMYECEYEIELFLDRTHDAAMTALHAFKVVSNKQHMLTLALRATAKEPSLQRLVRLQVELTKVHSGLDLFTNRQATETAVVFLFREGRVDLGAAIMNEVQLPPGKIGTQLIDVLVNEGPRKIIPILTLVEKTLLQRPFEQLVTAMLMRLYFVLGDPGLTLQVIMKGIADPDFKCRLLLHFCRVEEAFSIAKASKLTELLPLIGNMAQKANHAPVAEEVTRILLHKPFR